MSNNASASQGGEVSSNTDDDFSFKYTESGGLTARYLLISFDSKTNILTTSSDISGHLLLSKIAHQFSMHHSDLCYQ